MDPTSAFQNASGDSLTMTAMVVAGIGTTLILLWAGWASISAVRGWSRTRVDGDTYVSVSLRIVLVIIVLFWLFLSNT